MPLRMVVILCNWSYLKVCSLCIPVKEERVIYTLSVLGIYLKMDGLILLFLFPFLDTGPVANEFLNFNFIMFKSLPKCRERRAVSFLGLYISFLFLFWKETMWSFLLKYTRKDKVKQNVLYLNRGYWGLL